MKKITSLIKEYPKVTAVIAVAVVLVVADIVYGILTAVPAVAG